MVDFDNTDLAWTKYDPSENTICTQVLLCVAISCFFQDVLLVAHFGISFFNLVTARELFRQFGCSEKLYRNVLDPLLQVRLYAPAEQISAAATLSVLYYYVVAHQV